jgi:hypothetical protein
VAAPSIRPLVNRLRAIEVLAHDLAKEIERPGAVNQPGTLVIANAIRSEIHAILLRLPRTTPRRE